MTSNAEECVKINEAWRATRLERLREREGWLSLVALHFVTTDALPIDGSVVPPLGSRTLGTLHSADRAHCTHVTLTLAADAPADVTVDGEPLAPGASAELAVDRSAVRHGSLVWRVLRRGAQVVLRARDRHAPLLDRFAGVPAFAIDAKFRVPARFERCEPRAVSFSKVKGADESDESDGELVRAARARRTRPSLTRRASASTLMENVLFFLLLFSHTQILYLDTFLLHHISWLFC